MGQGRLEEGASTRHRLCLTSQVVVCIIADGRQAIHPRVLDCLSALGVYQDGVAKNVVEQQGVEKVVGAHVYEFTTQYSINPELKFKGLEKGIMPTQIVFCLKGTLARYPSLCEE